MVFREVSVIEIREALRAWLAGKSERAVAAQAFGLGAELITFRIYVTTLSHYLHHRAGDLGHRGAPAVSRRPTRRSYARFLM
jgi:hypothetical protein